MESAWYTIKVKYNANSKSCHLKCVKEIGLLIFHKNNISQNIISYRPGIHCQGQTNIDQKLSYYAHFDHKLDIVVQNWQFF